VPRGSVASQHGAVLGLFLYRAPIVLEPGVTVPATVRFLGGGDDRCNLET
jgi:hypothetical protein